MKAAVPFEFVLEELADQNPIVKPMFGAFGIYVGGKIVAILRDRPSSVEDNGVWIATTPEHHSTLRQEFPTMRSIQVFGPGVTGWQVLPVDDDSFEESVMELCALIRAGDTRIGKVPKARSSSVKKSKAKKKKTRR